MSSQKDIQAYYNALAPNYDQSRFENTYGHFIHERERRILQTLVDQQERVLSLACGTGRFMEFAHVGVDSSPEMVRIAQEKFPHKTFIHADGDTLPFKDNTFDTVFAFHLFMHLPITKIEAIAREVSRVLKPGGSFIFDYPSATRRNLRKTNSNTWHGQTALNANWLPETQSWTPNHRFSILVLPIQRIPPSIRKRFIQLDTLICRLLPVKYGQYIIASLTLTPV